jgi:hypothetical protein
MTISNHETAKDQNTIWRQRYFQIDGQAIRAGGHRCAWWIGGTIGAVESSQIRAASAATDVELGLAHARLGQNKDKKKEQASQASPTPSKIQSL